MGSGVSSPWEPSYAAPERGVARARVATAELCPRERKDAQFGRVPRPRPRGRTPARPPGTHRARAAAARRSAWWKPRKLGEEIDCNSSWATWPCPRSVRGTAEVSRAEGKKGTVGEQGDCLRAQGARPRRGGCDARLVRGRADGLDDAHRERVARAPCGGRWCACGSVPAPCAQHLAAYAPRVVSPARFLIAPSPLPAVSPSPAIPPRGTHAVQSWRLQARARCWSSTRL